MFKRPWLANYASHEDVNIVLSSENHRAIETVEQKNSCQQILLLILLVYIVKFLFSSSSFFYHVKHMRHSQDDLINVLVALGM